MKYFKYIIPFLFSLNLSSQVLPEKDEILETMRLVNDHWIQAYPDPGNNQWARAAYFTGNLDFYKVYPFKVYLDYTYQWANQNYWWLNGGVWTSNADNQTIGQVYIDLYKMEDPLDPSKIDAITQSINRMVANPDTWDAWWWIDALYMAMPVFVRLAEVYNSTDYLDVMYTLYTDTKVTRGLFNTESGLWYRDESFKPPYSTPNGLDSYWSRGNGWVFAAHARVLQLLPETDPHRQEYIDTYVAMAQALKTRQRNDGFWNVSLDDPDDFGGPETSGTSFFTYGMAWGINNGYLDSVDYYPVMRKAWEGLSTMAVHEDGYLGYIQGVGSNPSSSQPVSYETTADFGVGAFLLAGSELLKMAPGSIPQPPVFFVDSMKVMNETTLEIYFNDTLEENSALNSINYIIEPGDITSLSIGESGTSMLISVSPLQFGSYKLQITNLLNDSGDVLYPANLSFFYNETEITASGYEYGTSNTPDKTMDGDLGTRWSCEGSGEWIKYDLGEDRLVTSTELAFYNGNQRKAYFSISLSKDDENYIEVYYGESSGETLDLEVYDFEDQEARYVLITGYGNSQSAWNSITEVRINYEKTDNTVLGLSNIQVSEGTLSPSFNKDSLIYQLNLPYGTNEVVITAVPVDTNAIISGDGLVDLINGDTSVNIIVSNVTLSDSIVYSLEINIDTLDNIIPDNMETSVFPNPFRNKIYITLEGKVFYQLFDINGICRQSGYTEGQIDIKSEISNGIYLLKLGDGNRKIIKILKQD